jgi:hypothetical protein
VWRGRREGTTTTPVAATFKREKYKVQRKREDEEEAYIESKKESKRKEYIGYFKL